MCSTQGQTHSNEKANAQPRTPVQAVRSLNGAVGSQLHPAIILQRAQLGLGSLTAGDKMQLQRMLGNRAVGRLIECRNPIKVKPKKEGDGEPARMKPNNTGIPDNLRTGVECNTCQRQILQRVKDINIDKIDAKSDTLNIDKNITPICYGFNLTPKRLSQQKPGYIGSAIVYSGEERATGLAKKYVEGSQDWSLQERQARLGVKFGINRKASVDQIENNRIEQDVYNKTQGTFDQVKGKASSYIFGLTWGYSYHIKGLPGDKTTKEIREILNNGKIDGEDVCWKKNSTKSDKNAAITKFNELRDSKGIPYGALRSWVVYNGQNVNRQLKENNASPIYIHSIDADAPDFVTLKKKSSSPGYKKVLDAYDEVIDQQKNPELIIGGYNLLAQPEEHRSIDDYRYTVQSNVVDLAIRQAIHEVAPEMTYPTEPNFLIRADFYNDIERNEASQEKYAWGDKAFEGRNLIDNAIKNTKGKLNIVYDPLASIATSVKAGGTRLKIQEGKTYNDDTLKVKPHFSQKTKGQEIPLLEQYIVQAQSLAGASRLATAYIAAYRSMNPDKVPPKKEVVILLFHPVEDMVFALLTGTDIESVKYDRNPLVSVILERIKNRLILLQKNPFFKKIAKNLY